jgi:hypothetical protein
MNLRSFISVVSIFTLLVTNASFSFAETDQQIVLNSWIGKSQEELFSVWGRPTNVQMLPNSKTYWVNYGYQNAVYVPKTYTANSSTTSNANGYISPYGNISAYGNSNTSTTINESGGYNLNYNCSVDITLDTQTSKITMLTYSGNICNRTLLTPSHISPTGLQNVKRKKIEVEAFNISDSKKGEIVSFLRKDTRAYQMGLRNKDIILEKELKDGVTKYKIQRKPSIFSKRLIEKEISFPPTYHSWAYENFTPKQREIWDVSE